MAHLMNPSSPDPLNVEAVKAESVASRAGGRPPEEDSSDNPEAQARAILEESEDRIAEHSRVATTDSPD